MIFSSMVSAFQSLGIVAGSLIAIASFITLFIKKTNKLGEWLAKKGRNFMSKTVGQALKKELEATNGGSGFGDKMNSLAKGHVEMKENFQKLDFKVNVMIEEIALNKAYVNRYKEQEKDGSET